MQTWAPGNFKVLPSRQGQGFTLVEVLVALAVLGVFSLLSYQGLSRLLEGSAALKASLVRLENLDGAFRWLDHACTGALYVRLPPAPAEVRYRSDAAPPGLIAEIWRPVTDPGQPPQRLLLSLQNHRLLVVVSHLGKSPEQATSMPLIEGVSRAEFRVWDANAQPQALWPSGGALIGMPRAVEFNLTLEDGRSYHRLFAVP